MVLFIDDNLIYLKDRSSHELYLRNILSTLREQKLYAKLSKCEFGLDEVAFLGHVISKEGVSADPAKTQAIREWPTSKTVSNIKRFLGLTNYYRRFVKGCSKISRPMASLMKKECKFVWTLECEKVFSALKESLTTTPVFSFT